MTATALLLARHGESEGNTAATNAEHGGAETLTLPSGEPLPGDADVPLTPLGRRQAGALGRRLHDRGDRGLAIWSSPYRRALETTSTAMSAAGLDLPVRIDERLRDRELGVLDLHTALGVERRFPAEAERRRRQGKFWYRPPGGESWADVALRLRSVLPELLDHDGPVLVVAHDVVVSLLVYVCCGYTVSELQDLVAATPVGNASLTELVPAGGAWRVTAFAEAPELDPDAPDSPADEEPNDDVV